MLSLIPARAEPQQTASPGKASVRLLLPSDDAPELGSLTLETPAQHPMHKALRCRWLPPGMTSALTAKCMLRQKMPAHLMATWMSWPHLY